MTSTSPKRTRTRQPRTPPRRPFASNPASVIVRAVLALAVAYGCQEAEAPTSVGQSCVTGDESMPTFSGFALGEINIEGVGGSCGPELVCLVNQFQGRVSCPEGQAAGELGRCVTPEGEPVSVPVEPQLESRPAERHVFCSCRCAGPEPDADYCSCPSGMICEELIAPFGREGASVAGSYCTYPTAGFALEEASGEL